MDFIRVNIAFLFLACMSSVPSYAQMDASGSGEVSKLESIISSKASSYDGAHGRGDLPYITSSEAIRSDPAVSAQDDSMKPDVSKEVSVQDDSMKPDVSKEVSVQDDSMKPDVLEEVSAQDDSMKPDVSEEVSVQDDSMKPDVSKEVSAQDDSMKPDVSEEVSAQDDSMKPDVSKEVSVQDDSMKPDVSKEVSAQDDSMKPDVSKEVSAQDDSMKPDVSKEVSAQDDSMKPDVSEEVSAQDDSMKPDVSKEVSAQDKIRSVSAKEFGGAEHSSDIEESMSRDNVSWSHNYLRKVLGDKTEIPLLVRNRTEEDNLYDLVRINEAVVIALENNFEIKAAIEEGRSRYWDKMGSYSQYLPSVNLDLSIGHERSRPASFNDSNGDREADDRHLRRDRALLIKQPIFDLVIISDILSNSTKEELAKLDLLETQNTIASDTIKAYLRLLQSKIFTQLADEYLFHLADLTKIMTSRVSAGGAISADLDRILSRSSAVESAKVESGAEYEVAIAEFKRLTGVIPARLELPRVLVPEIPAEIDSALEQAYHNNPNYLASLKKIDLAKEDKNKSASGLVPKVYAQLSSDYTYNAGGSARGNPVDGVYPSQRTDKAVVVAQWSLYGGTSAASTLSGAAKQREMYLLSKDIQDKMDQALEVNYTAIRSARDRVTVLRKSVEANERMVKGFEEQFKSGTRSLFELLDAYEQLYNSRMNLTRAIFANSQAAFQILQQTGEIVRVTAKESQED